jgi:hypothetical protein
LTRFVINRMTKNKMIKVEIIKLLPDEWSYSKKYQFLQDLADEYKKKSCKEAYRSEKGGAGEDYSAIVQKTK